MLLLVQQLPTTGAPLRHDRLPHEKPSGGDAGAGDRSPTRDLILGTLLLIAGVVFGAIGLYALTPPRFFSMSGAVFGCFLGALFGLSLGGIQLARGLRGHRHG